MGPANIVVYGLGGVAAAGIIAFLFSKVFGRSKKSKLLDMFNKDAKQKDLQQDIKIVTKEQEVIAAQVKASEHASEEARAKIKKKLQKAAVEIQKTLKEDNLSAIDAQIDEDWKDL